MKEFDLVSTLGLIKLDSRFFHRGIIAQYLTTTEYSLADIRSDVVIRPGCVCVWGGGLPSSTKYIVGKSNMCQKTTTVINKTTSTIQNIPN